MNSARSHFRICHQAAGPCRNTIPISAFYLDDELKEVFSLQWEVRKQNTKLSSYVFPTENGIGKIKDFRGSWKKACKDASIGKRHFHDFRRTAVRNMVRSGVPERLQ
ncbi:MAG: tyrosine-type recombinase/integrase [Desulfobacterales bacterium]